MCPHALGERLRRNKTEIVIVFTLAVFSLRVVTWFEYPNILIGGDLRPPLNQEAFSERFLHMWDEVDFGMPSVYVPRILDPFYLFISISRAFGAGVFTSEVFSVFFLYLISTLLAYFLVRELTNNIMVSYIAAFFMTSNVFLVNDREILAISFIDTVVMVIPCLIFFVKAIKSQSYTMAFVSGVMVNFTYGYFPNYRPAVVTALMLFILWLYHMHGKAIILKRGSGVANLISMDKVLLKENIKLISVLFGAIIISSIWILVLIFSNIDFLFSVYSEMRSPWYSRPSLVSVFQLIPKWSFYSGLTINGVYYPYVPYSEIYMGSPVLLLLSSLLTAMGLSALVLCRGKKIAAFFWFVAVTSIFLVAWPSFTDLGMNLYSALMGLPLLNAFRESTNWMFFLVFSLSILLGLTTFYAAKRSKRGFAKVFYTFFVVSIIVVTSFPLYTGDISKNLISPEVKGALIPDYYSEINDLLSDRHWNLLLPPRETYVIYSFSGAGLSCGNPYPLLLSKPFVSGLGTEYLESGNTRMIDVLGDLVLNGSYFNVALLSKAAASSVQKPEYAPENGIDGDLGTRWASGLGTPQWFELDWDFPVRISVLRINFETAYAEDYTIETWDGSRWVVQMVVKDSNSTELVYYFPDQTTTSKLRIVFMRALGFDMVSLWEVEVLSKIPETSKLLSILGIECLVFEDTIIWGSRYEDKQIVLHDYENLLLVRDWGEVKLFNNTNAVEKIYIADNLITGGIPISEGASAMPAALLWMISGLEGLTWEEALRTAFVYPDQYLMIESFDLSIPNRFEWREVDPTFYEASAEINGSFLFVFLESYSSNWKLFVNEEPVPEEFHLRVNGFANGWLVSGRGELTMTLKYLPQQILTFSILASVIMPLALLPIVFWHDYKRPKRYD